jgi:hypothetical protein
MIIKKEQHTQFERAQWGSHIDMINKIYPDTIPFMLELGAGEYSTPVYAPRAARYISVQTDKEWFDYISKTYQYPNTSYLHIPDTEIEKYIDVLFMQSEIPDIVLVDHTHDNIPDHRATIANKLQDTNCKYIVIHDMCQAVLDKIVKSPNHSYYVNHASINPCILITRK